MLYYPKCNLHTHTVYSDGEDTPEEVVLEALRLGLHTVGFSDHSFTPFDTDTCASPQRLLLAKQEILRLKDAYRDQIRILCGIEQDSHTEIPAEGYDYVIGSVHYVLKNGVYYPVDLSREMTQTCIDQAFGGDAYHYVRAYYEEVAQVIDKTKGQIVGHFDLIEKFNEDDVMYSTEDYRYRRPMIDALDALLEKDVIFEINTGAMSRGYRTMPYPSPYVLRRIAEKRGRIMLNSDSHKKNTLIHAFEDAVQYAKACGVGGLTVPGTNGWEIFSLGSR